MSLQLRDLHLVDALARSGTLAGAADRLHLTPSAVGRQLASLERRLGTLLFRRRNGRWDATEAGELLLSHAERILAAVSDVQLAASPVARRTALRVAGPFPLALPWFGDVLLELSRALPTLVVDLLPPPVDPVLELELDRLDVAIGGAAPLRPSLAATPLPDEELVAIAAAGHRWRTEAYVESASFRGERLLSHQRVEGDVAAALGLAFAVEAAELQPVGDSVALLDLVARGAGVAVVPSWLAGTLARAGAIVARRVGPLGTRRTLCLLSVRTEPAVSVLPLLARSTAAAVQRAASGIDLESGR